MIWLHEGYLRGKGGGGNREVHGFGNQTKPIKSPILEVAKVSPDTWEP